MGAINLTPARAHAGPLHQRLPMGLRARAPAAAAEAVATATPRSNRPEVRNPLLAMPSVQRLQRACAGDRAVLALALRAVQEECAALAQSEWKAHTPQRAALFRATGVYAGHFRRALVAPGLPPLLKERASRRPRHDAVPALQPRSRRERRNLLLAIPAVRALASMPAALRSALADVLTELAADSRARGHQSWASCKAPLASYHLGAASYARHLCKSLLAPEQPRP